MDHAVPNDPDGWDQGPNPTFDPRRYGSRASRRFLGRDRGVRTSPAATLCGSSSRRCYAPGICKLLVDAPRKAFTPLGIEPYAWHSPSLASEYVHKNSEVPCPVLQRLHLEGIDRSRSRSSRRSIVWLRRRLGGYWSVQNALVPVVSRARCKGARRPERIAASPGYWQAPTCKLLVDAQRKLWYSGLLCRCASIVSATSSASAAKRAVASSTMSRGTGAVRIVSRARIATKTSTARRSANPSSPLWAARVFYGQPPLAGQSLSP